MNFFSGDLKDFNLCKMNEEVKKKITVRKCYKGMSICLDNEEQNKEIEEILKSNGELYYLFGNRKADNLLCINGEKYLIDDEMNGNSQGINMSEAYINAYEDINLGFLISYSNGNIDIQPAIEGEANKCRKCEIIDDCGDLNSEMKKFISKYII